MAAYFGVRHLSPACAHYVKSFLTRVQPQVVLIEGPSDLNELIPSLCNIQAKLPAAILAYTTAPPVQTVLWPFAEFSPEYQAMLWAVQHHVPVRFCDLPSSCILAQLLQQTSTHPEKAHSESESIYARLEHYTGMEHDTFWEYQFEHNEKETDFLAAVALYGASIREHAEQDPYNQLREAYMRRVIFETMQSGVPSEKIAVITGAFHTAGLDGMPFTETDRKMTEHLPEIAFKATLMPYSYYKLSSRSGYGAGSKAPGYYEILWENRKKGTLSDSAAKYLSRLAAYQREHGYTASAAEVIEALRLAETLGAMRGGRLASMTDLRDAAITCLGHGSFGEISLACADVEIGTKIGSLPEGTVCTSVQEDFTRQLKELKLERFRTAAEQTLELDLRENLRVKSEKSAFLDLHRSFFLHRLRVLAVHFGEVQTRRQDNATWAELWKLQWTPESEIAIVEASLLGDTIAEAARFSLEQQLLEAQTLAETASLLAEAFLCGLTETVQTTVSAVQKLAVNCISAADTGKTIGTLSGILRFGSIRRMQTEPLVPLMQQLFLRFCLCLPGEARCDRNAAEEIVSSLSQVNDACLSHTFLEEARLLHLLTELAENDYVHPLLSGFCCAIQMERGKLPPEQLTRLVHRRLSGGTPPAEGAEWFEGLAQKNRRALISRLHIWETLCDFIFALDKTDFKPVLICLRRTFAGFSPAEKADIAENIGEVLGISQQAAAEFIGAAMTTDEQEMLNELDEFDFGDI